MARKSNTAGPKLTDPELDLLAHMEHGAIGWRRIRSAETRYCVDSKMKKSPGQCLSIETRSKAWNKRGLIKPTKGQDSLAIVWRLTNKTK